MTLPRLAAQDDIFKGLKLDLSEALKEKDIHLANQYLCYEKLEVVMCLQATFVASVHSKIRAWVIRRKDEDMSPRSRRIAAARKKQLGKDFDKEREYKIGVLGCGKIGKNIIQYLLASGVFQPHQIAVSTRRPEDCRTLQADGIDVYYDNEKLARSVNLLILAVRPANMPTVANVVKGAIVRQTLVFSVVGGIPTEKLQSLLGIRRCVRPVFDIDATVKSKAFKAIRKRVKPGDPSTFLGNVGMSEFAAKSYCKEISSVYNLCLGLESSVTGMDMILEEIRVLCMMAVLGADVDAINFKATPASDMLQQEFPDIVFDRALEDEEGDGLSMANKVEDAIVTAFQASFCSKVQGRASRAASPSMEVPPMPVTKSGSIADLQAAPALADVNMTAQAAQALATHRSAASEAAQASPRPQ